MTHTYTILNVSVTVFQEIAEKLRAAGYGHAFDRDVIDMHGIAIRSNGEKRAGDLQNADSAENSTPKRERRE